MSQRMLPRVVVAVALFASLAACGGDDAPDGPSSAEVTVTKATPDPSYEVQPTARVTNEDYGDAYYAVVVVQARRGQSTSNRGPALTGALRLSDGSEVECEKRRSTIWSNFTDFEDFELKCSRTVDLATVGSVVVE